MPQFNQEGRNSAVDHKERVQINELNDGKIEYIHKNRVIHLRRGEPGTPHHQTVTIQRGVTKWEEPPGIVLNAEDIDEISRELVEACKLLGYDLEVRVH